MQCVRSSGVNEDGFSVGIQTVHKSSLGGVPVLQHPISENLVVESRGRGRSRHHLRFVQIEVGVRPGHGGGFATVAEILHFHAFGAIQFMSPSSIQIQFLGDPETIDSIFITNDVSVVVNHNGVAIVGHIRKSVRIMNDSPFVHVVCHIHILDIGGGDGLLGEGGDFREIAILISGIEIPTAELIQVALAGGGADFATVADTEVHGLGGITPVQTRICASLRVQENAVLYLAPPGIHHKVAHRHLIKLVSSGASIVHIPTVEHKPLLC